MLDSTLGIERSGYKIYPQSLENERAPYWFSEKMACDRSTVKRCFAAIALLEMLEEEDDIKTKRGKTRHWIKRREEKGYFTNIVRELRVRFQSLHISDTPCKIRPTDMVVLPVVR